MDGSTEISPIVFSGKSIKNRLTNSSTNEDLPEPPVPVIPNTGVFNVLFFSIILSKVAFATSGKFSAEEIRRAIAPISFFAKPTISTFNISPIA